MPKSASFPKHHNYKEIPAALRPYLQQLEHSLAVSEQERQSQSRLIKDLQNSNKELAKKIRR